MRRATMIAAACMLLLLAACRDSDEEISAEACTELGELQQSLAALEALGPSATIEQVQDAADNLREQAWDAAKAVRRVEDARYQELAEAQRDLQEAVRNLDDDDTVVQARAQLQPYVQEVVTARQNLTSSLGCQ